MKIILLIIFLLLLIIFLLLTSRIVITLKFDGNIKFNAKFFFWKYDLPIPILYGDKKEENTQVQYELSDIDLNNKKSKKDQTPFPGIKKTVLFIKDAITTIFDSLKKILKLEKIHFKATAASDDAAKTAELYGLMCTVGGALHYYASNYKKLPQKNVYFEIKPDFISETPDLFVDIRFSMRLFRYFIFSKTLTKLYDDYYNLSSETSQESKDNHQENQNKN